MRALLPLVGAFVVGGVAGCGSSTAGSQAEPVSEVVSHVEAATVAAGTDLGTPPESTIFFDPGWDEWVQGTLYGGARVGIVATPERFPNCGVDGELTAYVSLDGSEPLAVAMDEDQGGWPRASVSLPPATTDVEIWLGTVNADGCTEWDSNLGLNYRFAAHGWRPTRVRFASDWSEAAEGPIVAGGVLVVDYDLARLPECRGTDQYGLPAWDVVAHVLFDDGTRYDQSVAYSVQSSGVTHSKESGLALIPVPASAAGAQLWFENTLAPQPFPTNPNCPAWDSDFGQNYRFAIESAADGASAPGWVGDFDFVRFHRDPAEHQGDVDPAYYFDQMAGAEVSTWVEVQVWIPGLTDVGYASNTQAAAAASTGIVAQAVTDAWAGDADGWGHVALTFSRQQGNNFVYAFPFWKLRYAIYQSPPLEAGAYQYYVRFSTNGGSSWLRGGLADGHARRFVVAPTQDCSLFTDHPPAGCPAARGVGWAGNWGGLFTHACERSDTLAEPLVLTKSALGHDCMSATAEAWVVDLTDVDADPSELRAEVETDVGFASGGPLAVPVTYPLSFDGRVGNNYRFRWDLAEHVGRADRGDYRYRFRFSADGGQSWTAIGTADSTEPADWRALLIRNDSLDAD